MGYLTSIFVVLTFVTVLHCAPVDEASVKPPAAEFSAVSTTTAISPSSSTEQHTAYRRQTSLDDISFSKESDESSSSEENRRPARDAEHSAARHESPQQGTLGLIQTPPPITKEVPKHELPARERRGVDFDDSLFSGAHAVSFQSTTTATAGVATSSTTNKPY